MTSKNEQTRKEWLRSTLANIEAGSRILDAGAGQLANKPFCAHLDYVSQDFCDYEGVGNEQGLQHENWNTDGIDIRSDITAIPEADHSFDTILCSEVLEHVPYPEKALQELTRLLKPGGNLILTAPFCSLTHFAPYHFSSGFNQYFYQHHLENLGYQIEEISSNGNFFDYMFQELGRLGSVTSKYTDRELNRLDRFLIKQLRKRMSRYSALDSGSSELLCFGFHVKARKR